MIQVLHEFLLRCARKWPQATALVLKEHSVSYEELWGEVEDHAAGLARLGIARRERVAVWLEKRVETITAFFGASLAGAVFVPINPVLRPPQVRHILTDCAVRVLITSRERLRSLDLHNGEYRDLEYVVLVGGRGDEEQELTGNVTVVEWEALKATSFPGCHPRMIDIDMAAILYTSGSTGRPKGVVLSHRNLVVGGESVSQYLKNRQHDSILSALPLSFDAGLSQITTAFCVGARLVLLNYLVASDLKRICACEEITGITGVPPLWFQLSELNWSDGAGRSVRYFANTGGHMPRTLLQRLRDIFPCAEPYLMYGLTEAFRSTYLDPAEVDRRPNSIGKAIPNAEVLVVNDQGGLCRAGEEGELVHRGALVSLGYWNDPVSTAQRFRSVPGGAKELPCEELAVWSGDIVRQDEEGFLYYVGRRDDMIKTSGYRVSATEIEEVVYATGCVEEAVALGLPHPKLGQAIAVVAKPKDGGRLAKAAILAACRGNLPLYMLPALVVEWTELPRNPNGKIDRPALARELAGAFMPQQALQEGVVACTQP